MHGRRLLLSNHIGSIRDGSPNSFRGVEALKAARIVDSKSC